MQEALLEQMARAAYEKHPLRKIAFKDGVVSAPPMAWDELDKLEKSLVLDAQRAALKVMFDAGLCSGADLE